MVAGPRPDLVGRVLPVAVLTPHDKGVTLDVVLRVWGPPSRRGATLEMVLVPGTTRRVLLEGHTLQPMGEGPHLAFPEGRALAALFLVDEPVVGEPPPEEPAGLPNDDLDPDQQASFVRIKLQWGGGYRGGGIFSS